MHRASARSRRVVLAFVLSALGVGLAVPLPVAANGIVTTFTFRMYNSCVAGTGAPNTALRVELRSSGGSYQGHFKVTTDGNGSWGYRCFWGNIDPGDRLVASDGSNTRTYIVQPITFKANRVTDVISGKSVPNSSVHIFVSNCQVDWYSCNSGADELRPTNGQGAFSFDFTSDYNIRGGDALAVHWTSPQGDDQYRTSEAPQLATWLGHNYAWGIARFNTDVTVWLFDSHGTQRARFRDHASRNGGNFSSTFELNSRAVDVNVGDYVVSDLASDATLKVINFHPVFDIVADTIAAKCWKNRPFYVYAEHTDGDNDWFQATGMTNGNGNFSVNTMTLDSYDLRGDDIVDIECRNARGDELEETFAVPDPV